MAAGPQARLFAITPGGLNTLSTSGLVGVFGGGFDVGCTAKGNVDIAGSAAFAGPPGALCARAGTSRVRPGQLSGFFTLAMIVSRY